MFYYHRNIPQIDEATRHLEHNLIRYMPQIMTAQHPGLLAAQINTQVEFDLTFRSIAKEDSYQNKKIMFISGLNIDISPQAGQLYPLTKFVPWAAYFQDSNGESSTLEQQELARILEQQSTTNMDKVDLEKAISTMAEVEEIKIEL